MNLRYYLMVDIKKYWDAWCKFKKFQCYHITMYSLWILDNFRCRFSKKNRNVKDKIYNVVEAPKIFNYVNHNKIISWIWYLILIDYFRQI